MNKKNLKRHIESVQIAFRNLEFSHRIQLMGKKFIKDLFSCHLEVKGTILKGDILNDQDVHNFLYNQFHSHICSFWITIDEAFNKAFGARDKDLDSLRADFRVIIYMFRCAYSHEISEPKWDINKKYRKQYTLKIPENCRERNIEEFIFDFKQLQDQKIEHNKYKGIAGLKIFSNIAIEFLKQQA